MNTILEQLGRSSTWRGLIGILTAVGVKIAPDQGEAIIAGGIALIGLINVFRKS